MQLTKLNKDYNRFTLKLQDQSLTGLYWRFSTEEILFSMPYITFITFGIMVSDFIIHEYTA